MLSKRSPGRMPAAALLPAALLAALLLSSTAARADRCDDIALHLKSQIDGVVIGRTIANAIYLSHPAAKQVRLGCASRNVSNELSATAEGRKPSAAFLQFVAGAAAVIFTIPKADTLRGASRCLGRLGLLRGDDIKTRYRRLDMHCSRTKTAATITIARGRDE
ncbi:hypothetical protein HNR60_002263 [Rhodopseudomonas rhenobacensis]|uniref:Uncharacterized protein n=1 Tax=Rhodopseudomonas rhenobacensis TaxID=87461 RepID=A0A7W7Z3U2_9BRAD|nr:hypothetical protein [Rhodopseudomonas rhenobacensis]MBB5047506.1 hypothetical protein [Rhodopseudomonas rhenobacensis]